jgi:hypothetical protein
VRPISQTFSNPSPIAGNLIRKNGLSVYSVALLLSRQMPETAAIAKPAFPTGTIVRDSPASGARRQRPIRCRSSTRMEPKSVETPRM